MNSTRLSSLFEHLRSSLWLIPLLALLLSLTLALFTVWLDGTVGRPVLSGLVTEDVESARSVLSAVASAMLSFTALVFTITIVVLQLAASHYSPRVTREFLRDRQTKITLGLFLGTFTYALLVLRSVHNTEAGAFIPSLSVGVTYLLVFASLVGFIFYLDHISKELRVTSMIRRIAKEGVSVIAKRTTSEPQADRPEPRPLPLTQVACWRAAAGVLAHIDEPRLLELARKLGGRLELCRTIGDFVPHGGPLIEVRGTTEKLDDSELDEYASIGSDRTPQQDLGLAIRHLVDIALRAVSPSINDPTTAVQALDHIHDLLRRMARVTLPPSTFCDDDGEVRLVIPRLSWDALVTLALAELREAAAGQIQVSRRVLYLLDDLIDTAPPERRPPLKRERRLWRLAAGREHEHQVDTNAARLPDPQGLGVDAPH